MIGEIYVSYWPPACVELTRLIVLSFAAVLLPELCIRTIGLGIRSRIAMQIAWQFPIRESVEHPISKSLTGILDSIYPRLRQQLGPRNTSWLDGNSIRAD